MEFKSDGIEIIEELLKRLNSTINKDLAGFTTTLVEEQTKRRIRKEKTAPDGSRWKSWSPAYAKTRRSRHSLMINTGDLLKSIFAEYSEKEGTVSTDRVYAATHQFGRGNIPARPFFGLSEQNRKEFDVEVSDFFKRKLGI